MSMQATSYEKDEQEIRRAIDAIGRTADAKLISSTEHRDFLRRLHAVAEQAINFLIRDNDYWQYLVPNGNIAYLAPTARTMAESALAFDQLLETAGAWCLRMANDLNIVISGILGIGDPDQIVADELNKINQERETLLDMADQISNLQTARLEGRLRSQQEGLRRERLRLLEATADAQVEGGENASLTLETDFENFAANEYRLMIQMRRWAAGFLALSSVGVLVILYTTTGSFLSGETARVLAVTPVLAFAYYFIREAGHHRDASQQAKENAVRLKTIRAYSGELDPSLKEKLRFEFGQRVFNEKSLSMVDSDLDAKSVTSLLGAVAAVLGVADKK